MALVAIKEGPLPLMFEDALKNGKIQSASAKLARLLKNHKKPDGERLKPHTIRIGNQTPKGFHRSDFEEAWRGYLPSNTEEAATSATSATHDRGNVAAVATVAHTCEEQKNEEDLGFDL